MVFNLVVSAANTPALAIVGDFLGWLTKVNSAETSALMHQEFFDARHQNRRYSWLIRNHPTLQMPQ